MPWHLARGFRRSETHFVYRNEYANGEVQVKSGTATSRKTWELDLSLIAIDLQELREYFENHQGSMIPFYFYDAGETGWSYPTGSRYDHARYDEDHYSSLDEGVTVTGRYCVRFDCPYNAVMGLGTLRGQVPIRLIELVADPVAELEAE